MTAIAKSTLSRQIPKLLNYHLVPFSMASKRKTKVQDILFRSRIRHRPVEDFNQADGVEEQVPKKSSLPKTHLGLPANDPHSIERSLKSANTIPKTIVLDDDGADIDYFYDVVEDGVSFVPDEVMVERILSGDYDPEVGLFDKDIFDSDREETLEQLQNVMEEPGNSNIAQSFLNNLVNSLGEQGNQLKKYFTEDYAKEVKTEKELAYEESILPDEDEDGHLDYEEHQDVPENRIELPQMRFPGLPPFPSLVPTPLSKILQGNAYGDVQFPLQLPEEHLSAHVCIIGTPNAGKSVLVNSITRSLVTAVSPKRNTTREHTIGVFTDGNVQLTLYDTPGINEITSAKQFQRELATEAWSVVGDCDMALVVIDAAKKLGGPELFLLHKLRQVADYNPHLRLLLVLNKVDLVEPKAKLISYVDRILPLCPITDTFMISALDGDGVAELENYLFVNAVPREWEYDREAATDVSQVEQATEIIRQHVYQRLHKEIPYVVEQENIGWQLLKNGAIRIDQKLHVEKESHRQIIVGAGGAALKHITDQSIKQLEAVFRRKVHLYLRVSIKSSNAKADIW